MYYSYLHKDEQELQIVLCLDDFVYTCNFKVFATLTTLLLRSLKRKKVMKLKNI